MLDAIRAARAYVETFFDDGAAKGIRQLQSQLKSMGDTATAAGGKLLATAAPILGFGALAASQFATAAAGVDKLSQQTQLSAETIGELSYVAQQSGTALEELTENFNKQTKVIAEARAGSSDAAAKLQKLGLTVKDVANLSADEAFALFADRISAIEDPTKKAAAAMAIYEDGGTKLLPMLNLGSEGLARMRQEAQDLGVVMSSEDIAAGEELADWMNVISQQGQAATNAIGAALAPALSDLLAYLSPILTDTIEWIRENDELIVQIVSVAAGVAAGGAALVGMGVAAGGLAAGLGGVATVASVVGSILGALLSPIGLVAAGIAGLIAYTVDWSDVWEGITGELGESLGLAADLIQNGEITAAFDLVWAQIQSTWSKGMAWTVEHIGDFIVGALTMLASGVDKVASMVEAVWNKIARMLSAAGEFLGVLPEGTTDELKQMQEAGQVGESSLHGLAKSIQSAADGFTDLGGNVGEAQARLDELKKKSIALNQDADRRREEEALAKSDESAKPKKKGFEPMLNLAPGGQTGTFSANASRMLYSAGGQSEVVAAVDGVKTAVNKVESAIAKKQRVGA